MLMLPRDFLLLIQSDDIAAVMKHQSQRLIG